MKETNPFTNEKELRRQNWNDPRRQDRHTRGHFSRKGDPFERDYDARAEKAHDNLILHEHLGEVGLRLADTAELETAADKLSEDYDELSDYEIEQARAESEETDWRKELAASAAQEPGSYDTEDRQQLRHEIQAALAHGPKARANAEHIYEGTSEDDQPDYLDGFHITTPRG